MPIEEKQTCNMHTEEKKESGTCCQKEQQENAEALTYEHSPISLRIHALAKSNPTKTYRELEQMKEQYE